jgi:D-glycero-alpha-D-manno-heptose-7-phosphate kinase
LDFGMSVTYSDETRLVYDGKLDLVKAAILKLGGSKSLGYDLFLQSDAPPGSGLGASSAMMVALVGALKEFKGLPLTDYEIADLASVIERRELGIPGGLQDQYAAAFGGFNYIEFFADRVIVNPLKVSPDIVNELQFNLLLAYTGKVRLSGDIIEDQVQRYERGEEDSRAALRAIKELAVEMKNALLRRQLDEFADLLHLEWEHKKRMSHRISSPDLDHLYDVARRHGAIGGKITGAGGGGYMLLYCDFERKSEVGERLRDLGCTITDFSLEPSGLQTWRLNDARNIVGDE